MRKNFSDFDSSRFPCPEHSFVFSYKEFDYFANTIWRVLAYAQMRWLELFIEMVRMICTFCEMNLVCVLFVLDLGWLFCLFYFIISLAIKLVAVTHSTRFKVLSYSTLNRIQNRQIPIHRITIGLQSFRITIFVVNRDHKNYSHQFITLLVSGHTYSNHIRLPSTHQNVFASRCHAHVSIIYNVCDSLFFFCFSR